MTARPVMIGLDKWDERYLDLAEHVSSWSKDRTKIGAVAVGEHGQVLSTAYNGFPRGVNDTAERLEDRPTKYRFTVHAEMNCLHNASLTGTSLRGSTMYVHGLPICSECAKGVIQSGIRKVVSRFDRQKAREKWIESTYFSDKMFREAGVIHTSIET